MREQRGINATTFKRRASLPPEDTSYITTRTHYKAPAPEDVYGEEDTDEWPPRMPTSSRRYRLPPGQYTQGNTRFHVKYEAPPARQRAATPQRQSDIDERVTESGRGKNRIHWLVFVGVGMVIMVMGWVVFNAVSSWWQTYQDDRAYGRPRTFQINAVVGHNDSASNPSHFIALNLNRRIEVIEFPGGDPTHARIYLGVTLFGDGQELTPVTLTFKDVNGDAKPDMLIHVADQTIIFINDQGGFRPLRPGEHITLELGGAIPPIPQGKNHETATSHRYSPSISKYE